MAQGLPGGASSLNETFDDWNVNCRVAGTEAAPRSACVVRQVQMQQNTRKRLLAVNFVAQPEGALKGSLVMPFGLDLATGVKLRLDQGEPTPAIAFKTCMPQGCIIPIDWKAPSVQNLRVAATLNIEARSVDGTAMPLTVSLKGFSAALDRAITLAPAGGAPEP